MDKKPTELKLKDKTITFNLLPFMTMPIMLRIGYTRVEIDALFKKLQECGYGIYTLGTLGKSGAAKFESNDTCPKQYTIAFKVKRLHKDYTGAPEKTDVAILQEDGTSLSLEKKPLTAVEILKAMPRSLPRNLPTNRGIGYMCTIAGKYLFLDRLSERGHASIELALSDIWDEVKDCVSAKGTKLMTPKQEVISQLMGKAFYKLSENPINNSKIDSDLEDAQ